jgi:hypothetical protein
MEGKEAGSERALKRRETDEAMVERLEKGGREGGLDRGSPLQDGQGAPCQSGDRASGALQDCCLPRLDHRTVANGQSKLPCPPLENQ